jgi:histidinol-phosphate aminotransferase
LDLEDTGIKEHLFDRESPCYKNSRKNDNLLDCYHGINPYGPAPEVEEALEKYNNDHLNLHKYPIHRNSDFVEALEQKWMAETGYNFQGQIRLSTGAKTVLENVNRMVIQAGDTVVGIAPQYTNYVRMVESMGANYSSVQLRPEENLEFSTTRMVNKIQQEEPELVYIDNPNNPTGQFIDKKRIAEIAAAAEQMGTLVLVDEAYGGFLDRKKSAASLTSTFDNLIVARSFSKAHGLAGARSGYAVMSEKLVDVYDKVRIPYKMSTVALVISEIALENEDHLRKTGKKLKTGQQRIIDAVDCEVMETHMGSPIFTMKSEESEDLWKELKNAGILTNSGENFQGLDSSYVRVRAPENAGEFLLAYQKLKEDETIKRKVWE